MNLTDVTPNLIVADIARSSAFYQEVLGFSVAATVPDASPFVFVWLQRGGVSVFLNAVSVVRDDHPELAARPIGGTATMYMTVEAESVAAGIDALFAEVESSARVIMPLTNQFYGMREFGIEDPDGYVLFFAQPVA